MADVKKHCDVVPLIKQSNVKSSVTGVRRNFNLSVFLSVLLLSAVVYFAAQVVFPYAVMRSEHDDYHNHNYTNPLHKLTHWFSHAEDNATNKIPATDDAVQEEILLIPEVQVTQGTVLVAEKSLQIQVDGDNNPEVKEAQLHVLSKEKANKTGAYCLDGSPPAYYFRKGSGTGRNSWIVWLDGGGACVDLTACYQRSFTDLGSSKALHSRTTFPGILSERQDINPDFHTWNAVLLVYCDGFFFAGNREDVVKHNDRSLYFRGRRNLNALIDRLVQTGMGEADRIILSGGSAGAIGMYWGADDVMARLPISADVKILPDSGMFMNLPDKDGIYSFNDSYTTAVELHDAYMSVNNACLASHPKYENWVCHGPEHLVSFEPAPIFILNCLYDSVALNDVVKTTCRPDKCKGKDMAAVQNYRTAMLQVAESELREKDGAFLITCFEHGLNNDQSWTNFMVNNKSVRQAVGDWYFGRTPHNVNIDLDPDLNPTCKQHLSNKTEIQSIWC